ncbi:prophage tail fiber N-terminal domain-containing protein [Erwinia phyllosphaerae]|uniref:prophage tail fiber N-terminal domain-containing protein n=1 Tax=Erwinia phyllosphaerae TaxID=2853256 RepID=UPI001FEDB66E|nr:prophage tail fiber N-terminal domain-containing protein [Erwinia phyllosphaerae]MBV4366308.1 prophage tail fiber N-terminal domain-containing protein [Erwinia phyllosphaerae]
MAESIQISGVLRDPLGAILSGTRITISSTINSTSVLKNQTVTVVTDNAGNYSFSLLPGGYSASIEYARGGRQALGKFQLQTGSEPGSLNDYILYGEPILADPVIYNAIRTIHQSVDVSAKEARTGADNAAAVVTRAETVAQDVTQAKKIVAEAIATSEEHVQSASSAAVEAVAARDEALAAANTAQSITDSSGTYSSVSEGLANTLSGDYFRVAQGTGSAASFIFYRNNKGEAEIVTSQASANAISAQTGTALAEFRDSNNRPYARFDNKGELLLRGMERGVRESLNSVVPHVKTSSSSPLLEIQDANGTKIISISGGGDLYIPKVKGSVQSTLSAMAAQSSVSAEIIGNASPGSRVYAVLPDGYAAGGYQWTRDGEAIANQTARNYLITADDIGHSLGVTVSNVVSGVHIADNNSNRIGGIALETAGAADTIYDGYVLSVGDDFNNLDIISPARPLGRWFTTRTYLNPPRGSDTLLGTMYNTDPYHTGHNDSNRGVPVGFDAMAVTNGVLKLTARRGTASELKHVQGKRTELAAMVSSAAAFAFYAGEAGRGDVIIEWMARFTQAGKNPAGWHPALWTQSCLPSYTFDSDEMDIIEGNSKEAYSNWNLWGSDGSRTGGGSLGGAKDLFDNVFHKVTAILNTSGVKIYIDDVLTHTSSVNANSKSEPGYLLMSSHVYNGNFDGDQYKAAEWGAQPDGATIYVDWVRIWRRADRLHVKPLVAIDPISVDYGQEGTITLPPVGELWGVNVVEHVQVIMAEENEPGGSRTASYNCLPDFVTYDAVARQIKIFSGYTKSGRLNFVIYGYLSDGSTCEPVRTYVNVGPNIKVDKITLSSSSTQFDLYAACDCGVLVTDDNSVKKIITVTGLPAAINYESSAGLLKLKTTVPGNYTAVVHCTNSAGQSAEKQITITVN